MAPSVRATFRASSDLDLAALDTRARPVGPRDKGRAADAMAELTPRLAGLQDRLYAAATVGDPRAVLLVLQGMDTSGKGGVIRHVAGLVDPQGLHIASFKAPTPQERAHPFLWRIRRQVPPPGLIGVFDRSHYEDVLIVRVDALVPEDVWRGRYAEIVEFEAGLAAAGVTVLKCMLHVSPAEQAKRLTARLDDPDKHWKYNPADLDSRSKWSAYQDAYAEALRRTDSDVAPWYIVPADRKWYRNWTVAALLTETLSELDLHYPETDIDAPAERAKVLASTVG